MERVGGTQWLGWIGKNSLLLNRSMEVIFPGEIIIDLEMEADGPINKDYCGSCTLLPMPRPTDAIVETLW